MRRVRRDEPWSCYCMGEERWQRDQFMADATRCFYSWLNLRDVRAGSARCDSLHMWMSSAGRGCATWWLWLMDQREGMPTNHGSLSITSHPLRQSYLDSPERNNVAVPPPYCLPLFLDPSRFLFHNITVYGEQRKSSPYLCVLLAVGLGWNTIDSHRHKSFWSAIKRQRKQGHESIRQGQHPSNSVICFKGGLGILFLCVWSCICMSLVWGKWYHVWDDIVGVTYWC